MNTIENTNQEKRGRDRALYRFDAGQAGQGTIDLATGKVSVVRSDLAADSTILSVGISQRYDSETKSWQLNLAERLEKERSACGSGSCACGGDCGCNTVYRYTDGAGERHTFEEKYYYKEGGKKRYVDKCRVEIAQDRSLSYTENGTAYEVTAAIQTPGGLVLQPEIKDFINADKIEARHEDLIQVEQEITQLTDTVEDLIYTQYAAMGSGDYESFAGAQKALERKTREMELNANGYKYREQEDKDAQDFVATSFVKDENGKDLMKLLLEKQKDVYDKTECSVKSTYHYGPQSYYTYESKAKTKLNQDVRDTEKTYLEITSKLNGYSHAEEVPNPTGYPDTYKSELENMYHWQDALRKQQKNYQDYLLIFQQAVQALTYLREQDAHADNERIIEIKTQLYQITDLYQEAVKAKLQELKRDYPEVDCAESRELLLYRRAQKALADTLKVLDYKLFVRARLLEQLPTDMVVGTDGLTRYFNAAGQLVLIADANENCGYITYKDGKVDRVVNGEERETAFFYENGLLLSVCGHYGKKVLYGYDAAGRLNRVTFPDGEIAEYAYGEDGLLCTLLCCMRGVEIEYGNGKAAAVKPFTECERIYDGGADRCLRTYLNAPEDGFTARYEGAVTETSQNGVTAVTVFNADGTPRTAYEKTPNLTSHPELLPEGSVAPEALENYFYVKHDTYSTVYEYDSRGRLVRVTDPAGMVEERFYDEKGRAGKSAVYHKKDAANKFVTEKEYAENGQVLAEFDERGAYQTRYEYLGGTNIINTVTDARGGKTAYGRDSAGRLTAISQSDGGEENGNVLNYTSGVLTLAESGNSRIEYEYDGKLRRTAVKLNGAEHVRYAYEDASAANGRVETVTASFADGTAVERKTDRDRNELSVKIDGQTQAEHTYAEDGRPLTSADGVTGKTRVYSYDGEKKVECIADGALTEAFAYDAFDAVVLKTLTGEVNQTYAYAYRDDSEHSLESTVMPNGLVSRGGKDLLGRAKESVLTDAAGSPKFGEYLYYAKYGDHATHMVSSVRYGVERNGKYAIGEGLRYAYDPNGNISAVYENGELLASYAYDALNRLVREDNAALRKTYLFTYDNNGNLLSKREAEFTRKPTEELSDFLREIIYAYDAEDGDRLTAFDGQEIAYAAGTGNPVRYRGQALAWEKGRQLKSYGGTAFSYDGYGRRIQKGGTRYVYDSGDNLVMQTDGVHTLEFYYNETGLAGISHNGAQYICRKNVQGDIINLFDLQGNVVVKYVYDAWGNQSVERFAYTENGKQIAANDPAHIGNLNPFRYRSYYYDVETGLYYLKSRYYDPEAGRFINADAIEYFAPETINGLNIFTYCLNNPISYFDPNGNKPEWWQWLLFGIGAMLVVAATVVLAVASGGAAFGLIGSIAVGAAKGALIGAAVGSAVGIAGGAIYAGVTGADMGQSILSGFLVGFGTGAIIGAVIGGFAGASSFYKTTALQFTNNPTSSNVILGRSIDNYNLIAQQKGATYFHTSTAKWNQVKNMTGIGNKGMWKINKAFLKQQISAGKNFFLASQPIKGSSFFAKEIAFLIARKIPFIIL